jgi:hypothetical protein
MFKKKCATCNKEFFAKRLHKRWCSDECRVTWRRNQYPAKYRHGQGVFRADPKGYHLRWLLEKRYGITLEQYDEMVAAQGGRCAICNKLPKGTSHTSRRLAVDHDHATGTVRGLLCSPCNTTIGMIEDSPGLLDRMRRYLGKHAQLRLVEKN